MNIQKHNKFPTSSLVVERMVIHSAMSSPDKFNILLELGADSFHHFKGLVTAVVAFFMAEKSPPTEDSFNVWCNTNHPEYSDSQGQLEQILSASHPPETNIATFTTSLKTMRLGRELTLLANDLVSSIETISHEETLQLMLQRLMEIQSLSSAVVTRTRKYYYETAWDRWKRFEDVRQNPDKRRGIKFGMRKLDEPTGGLHAIGNEADVLGIYGKSGAYKSRLKLNIAYNQASAGVPVMYITREMSAERVTMLLDARESLLTDAKGGFERLEYRNIEDALLAGKLRDRYKNLLLTVLKRRRYPLWIIDAPAIITTADIIFEIEAFRSLQGFYPRVMFVDYANLILPTTEWSSQSEKFDNLFMELASIAKQYRMPVVTSTRESRKGTLQQNREDVDQEHLALSAQMIYHCHHLWHIDQTKEDRAQNLIKVRSKKNRYGELFDATLFVAPEYNYIGDQDVNESSYDFE